MRRRTAAVTAPLHARCSVAARAPGRRPTYAPPSSGQQRLHDQGRPADGAVQDYVTNAASAEYTYGPIADWNVSRITDMSFLFYEKWYFNADISSWDTSTASRACTTCSDTRRRSISR